MNTGSVIIDGDTGRDDALAIWCALSLGMPLAAVVASYGNVVLPRVIENCARVLAVAGRGDIPVFTGASGPSRPHKGFETVVRPRQEASGNGLCNLEFPEAGRPVAGPLDAETLMALSREHGPAEYFITGPATFFSSLCDTLGDDIHRAVARVTMMGGKLEPLWSAMPGADFNLVCDPYAVRNILVRGFEMRFVPMNMTWPVSLSLDEVEKLETSSALSVRAKDLMIAHCRFFAPEPVFRFHDPCVVMAALAPSCFSECAVDVACDEDRADFGRIEEKADGFPVRIAKGGEETRRAFLDGILAALGLARS